MKITYKEIFDKLEDFTLNHYYMSDMDKYGELDIYDWNKKEYTIEDNHIKPKEKEIYQDCETFALRCILGLIDIYGEDIKENLKMMIGSMNGTGHGFFTFIAEDSEGIEREFLWDNNLPCPLPLDIILLTGQYQVNYIYLMDKKEMFRFEKDEILKQLLDYNGVKVERILKMKSSRESRGRG